MTTLNPEELGEMLEMLGKRLNKAVRLGAAVAAEEGVDVVKESAPVAWGHLRETVHARHFGELEEIVVDAPHAQAVEKGSRPHLVPLDVLIAWVKLRGMQGLSDRRRKLTGSTSLIHAISVAAGLKQLERRGRTLYGRHSPINAPEILAREIQEKIRIHGTRPTWFVRRTLPKLEEILVKEVSKSIREM